MMYSSYPLNNFQNQDDKLQITLIILVLFLMLEHLTPP